MIIATVHNTFKLYGTDTFDVNVDWNDADGNLIDLSDWHARLRLFVSKQDRTLLHEITDGDGITLGDGSASPNIACTIPDEDVVALASLPTYLTLELEDPNGDWQRLVEGKVLSEQ